MNQIFQKKSFSTVTKNDSRSLIVRKANIEIYFTGLDHFTSS
jgi:hypothetical protein